METARGHGGFRGELRHYEFIILHRLSRSASDTQVRLHDLPRRSGALCGILTSSLVVFAQVALRSGWEPEGGLLVQRCAPFVVQRMAELLDQSCDLCVVQRVAELLGQR